MIGDEDRPPANIAWCLISPKLQSAKQYFAGVTIACILTGKSYGAQIKINNDDDVFSLSVAQVEDFLKQDRLFYPHCMQILYQGDENTRYTQLLESYRSLTLQYMADAFGVSEEFIDK